MRRIVGTVTLIFGLTLIGSPAIADTGPLPPVGAAPTCWVDVTWFPNVDNLPPCPAEAQPTLYQFARAILVWQSGWDILGQNVHNLQRANVRKYHKIRRQAREIRHLRAQLAAKG